MHKRVLMISINGTKQLALVNKTKNSIIHWALNFSCDLLINISRRSINCNHVKIGKYYHYPRWWKLTATLFVCWINIFFPTRVFFPVGGETNTGKISTNTWLTAPIINLDCSRRGRETSTTTSMNKKHINWAFSTHRQR